MRSGTSEAPAVECPGMGASPVPSAKGEKRETEETSEELSRSTEPLA